MTPFVVAKYALLIKDCPAIFFPNTDSESEVISWQIWIQIFYWDGSTDRWHSMWSNQVWSSARKLCGIVEYSGLGMTSALANSKFQLQVSPPCRCSGLQLASRPKRCNWVTEPHEDQESWSLDTSATFDSYFACSESLESSSWLMQSTPPSWTAHLHCDGNYNGVL